MLGKRPFHDFPKQHDPQIVGARLVLVFVPARRATPISAASIAMAAALELEARLIEAARAHLGGGALMAPYPHGIVARGRRFI